MGSVYLKESVKYGQWYVDRIGMGRYWYIFKKGTKQKKRIGKVTGRGTNYYDIACNIAEERNKKIKWY